VLVSTHLSKNERRGGKRCFRHGIGQIQRAHERKRREKSLEKVTDNLSREISNLLQGEAVSRTGAKAKEKRRIEKREDAIVVLFSPKEKEDICIDWQFQYKKKKEKGNRFKKMSQAHSHLERRKKKKEEGGPDARDR